MKIMRDRTFNKLIEESYVRGQRSDAKKVDVPLNVEGNLTIIADTLFVNATVNIGGNLEFRPGKIERERYEY